MRVTTADELPLIMRSKYVQSDLSPVLPLIIEELQSGKAVLFAAPLARLAQSSAWQAKKS